MRILFHFMGGLITCALCAGVPSALAAPPLPAPAMKLTVPAGSGEVHEDGRVSPQEIRRYRFDLKSGRELHLRLLSSDTRPVFQLLGPDGVPIYDSHSGASGPEYDGLTDASGTYEIRVFLLRAQTAQSAPAPFTLSLMLD
ncbi:hypothetical protein [Brytella acorum]|uniref:DNA breaking-rejoining protein n=1 Tax=Brytella acorum TaxID=2959299 RepID=A0AA35XWK1_9PROT|nr:hypothetical protein [Brytella acorum]MDF3624589.1 hypothetical protein [Brytella acorum]CAI9120945.1 hypothetical protein LMG32879_001786 [Brytella acorum]